MTPQKNDQTNLLDSPAQHFVSSAIGTDNYQVLPLAGDASSRRYMRIVYQDKSSVLMIWEPFTDDGHYPFLNVLQHFAHHGVHVPFVVGKAPKLGLVLLEDLGDLTLERKFWESQNYAQALPDYHQAIDEIIKIHYAATNDRTSGCTAFGVDFNVEKLLWEMNYGFEHLIEKFCKVQLAAKDNTALQNIFVDICTQLHNQPKHICHRDYHSRNIMLKLGKTYVIDFQDARTGPIQYDLVSLVHDSYVDMGEQMRQEVLDYYVTQANAQRKTPINRAEFQAVFKLQMLQRCFKACGSFSSFYNMREDLRYLKYLKPTVMKVAQALEDYPQYKLFLNIMRDNGLLELDYLNPTKI